MGFHWAWDLVELNLEEVVSTERMRLFRSFSCLQITEGGPPIERSQQPHPWLVNTAWGSLLAGAIIGSTEFIKLAVVLPDLRYKIKSWQESSMA